MSKSSQNFHTDELILISGRQMHLHKCVHFPRLHNKKPWTPLGKSTVFLFML